MQSPDDWRVGITLETGDTRAHGSGGGPNPSAIETVHIPIFFPWSNELQIRPAELRHVASQERGSGEEKHYSARVEDIEPDPVDETWEIEFEIWEYPPNTYNTSMLRHTDNIIHPIVEDHLLE